MLEEESAVGDGVDVVLVLIESVGAEAAMIEAIASASTELEVAVAETEVIVEEDKSVVVKSDAEDELDPSKTSTFIPVAEGVGEEPVADATV